jgi:hypothetical protein
LRLWIADSGEQLALLEGHEGAVLAAAWSPDGKRLLSAGYDTTLRFWDVASYKEIKRICQFREDAWATIDPVANCVIRVSGEAWRWLGWSGIDPATGRMERWPAEIFGPLQEWKQEGRH